MRCPLAITVLFWAASFVSARYIPSTSTNGPVYPSLLDADLEDLVTGLESGAWTSVDLVNAYSARILEVNSTLHMVRIAETDHKQRDES